MFPKSWLLCAGYAGLKLGYVIVAGYLEVNKDVGLLLQLYHHTYPRRRPAFFSFIPHLLHKKVVVTIHGLDWDRAKWSGFAKWYIKQSEKNAVKYADEIIVLSQGVREYFLKEYKRETKFIPNGVNKPEIREAEEIKKWGLEKDNYVLYLGRIVTEKGEHYLVEA